MESRGLQAEWNLDAIKKGDLVTGNFVYQTFDTDIQNFDNSYYYYELIDDRGK